MRTVQYITEILLQKHANALLIAFYKTKGLLMSQTQYKKGKIISLLQKMRLLHILKKLNVYKPCLLIVDINGIDLAILRINRVFCVLPKYSFYARIKSLFAMYFKCYKFYNKRIAIHIYNWALQNLGVTKFLIGIGLKVRILQKIDKTMRLVYMETLSNHSGVILKQTKAVQKAVTWRNLA
ncbi:hypothetical protein [Bartonella kosoyi]|uniref:hypothetical protein n=1 Tax=Bartonella kosoyi TaxID=2133959 RepID=UPI001FCE3415|nr:hypothetical protein [Bartonella kosoyi]